MSGKYSSLGTFIFIIAIAFAANRAEEASSTREVPSTRGPASISSKMPLAHSEKSLFRHTEKTHGPIEAAIQLLGAQPSQPGDVFVLSAVINSEESLDDVDFKWSVPKEGVEIVNGELNGHIAQLKAGQPVEVQITLKTLTGEDHKVSLMAGAALGNTRFAESAQYSTLLQPVLEASREVLKKSTQKSALEIPAEKQEKLKIFH